MPALEVGLRKEVDEEGVADWEPRKKHYNPQHHRSRRRRRGSGGGGTRQQEERRDDAFSPMPTSTDASALSTSCSDSSPFFIVNSSSSSLLSQSADRCCSFGSDRDPAASSSHISFHLAGSERCSTGGPGDPAAQERRRASFDISLSHNSKGAGQGADDEAGEEDGAEQQQQEEEEGAALDPAKHSFSLALRECQNRHMRRPASLDFSNQGSDASVSGSSPRSCIVGAAGMRKSSAAPTRSRSGMLPSPGTPNYLHGNGPAAAHQNQKGWSSERVPLPANSLRKYGSSASLLPLGSGKALPSKWEDAEKWILSPVSGGDGVGVGVGLKNPVFAPHHRRPKSKSGPIGNHPAGGGGSSSASPLVYGFNSGRVRSYAAHSPLMTGVLVTDGGCCGGGMYSSGGGGDRAYSEEQSDQFIARSASMNGWSDTLESSSSMPSSRDEKSEIRRDVASTKDMATQMSPEGSAQSSPNERTRASSSPPPSNNAIAAEPSPSLKFEIRDVQVDDRVTVTRWSKKNMVRGFEKGSANIIQWKKKATESRDSSWEVAETNKCVSKLKREESKITAWENLQKAKAEADIQKLEMKLEKKRASSIDKILKKLRAAQKKAEEMRVAVTSKQTCQATTTTKRAVFFRKTGQIGCFAFHIF